MKHAILAADLGGTNLRMAVVDLEGEILYRVRRATPPSRTREPITQLIAEVAEECRNAVSESFTVTSFGFAVPAVVQGQTGTILSAPNLPDLDGYDFGAALSQRLSLPVIIENDANAAAVGEHWRGASQGARTVIHVTLGTGVGGGLILNDEPWRGIDGTAGEIGHICVEPFGAKCGCGNNGCLEQYASASAVVRMATEILAEYPGSKIADLAEITAHDVYQAGVDGDEAAVEVFRKLGFYLGVALGGLVNVLNPEVVVIGGGASNAWDLFEKPLAAEVKKRAFDSPAERAKIVRATIGDDAGILGAALLAMRYGKEAAINIA